jgi:hypothetical protein
MTNASLLRLRWRGIQTLLHEIPHAPRARRSLLLQTLSNALEAPIIAEERVYAPGGRWGSQ